MTDIQRLLVSPDGHARAHDPADPGAPGDYLWIVGSPEDPEIADWCRAHLPSLVAQALLQAETRPRTVVSGDGMLMILRGVNLNPEQNVDDMVSLRTYVAPGLAITLRHRPVFALRAVLEDAEAGRAPASPADLLLRLSHELIERIEDVSLDLEDRVDEMEERVFDGAHETTPDISDLAQMRRATIRMRRHVGPMAVALHEAARALPALNGTAEAARAQLAETANRATRSVEELEAARDRLTALAEHLDMTAASRQQRNGYLLSVIAAIFLPLTFVSGLFGVNVAGMPGTNWAPAFWLLLGVSVVAAAVLALLFRYKRWF
ncbi:CorA family divalent cation transporter [Roseovarius aestuariivivens]|uniref:CorA family divalent cation transporter n=1 Tax=Roseovarius aestuariivivens TaxID=1888910 RepID=UPI00143671A7|nr:CorA family divalent cation transporter [Roseovarius aestuariivivens]